MELIKNIKLGCYNLRVMIKQYLFLYVVDYKLSFFTPKVTQVYMISSL